LAFTTGALRVCQRDASGFAAADRMTVINPGRFLSTCRVISGRWYFLGSRFSETYRSIECTLEVLRLVWDINIKVNTIMQISIE